MDHLEYVDGPRYEASGSIGKVKVLPKSTAPQVSMVHSVTVLLDANYKNITNSSQILVKDFDFVLFVYFLTVFIWFSKEMNFLSFLKIFFVNLFTVIS